MQGIARLPLLATILVLCLDLGMAPALAAQPAISGINKTTYPLSGRVVIHGTGFGSSGEVFVDGLSAWVSTWTDTRIVAYVPESAPLGSAALYVDSGGQVSNQVALTVSARQPEGRIRWTFEADSSNLWYRPALAPDGTIYLHTNNDTEGLVYALSPEGALLWIQKVVWYPYVPPSAGPDGSVYVGSIATIYRISPTGEILWQFRDPGAQGVQVAPTIGPDGMLYAAYDGGLGAISLTPAVGGLRWSNPGTPAILCFGCQGKEARFGPSQPGGAIDQFYLDVDWTSELYGFTLDGEQVFAKAIGVNSPHEPAVGSDGTLFVPGRLELSVLAVDPTDGGSLWQYSGQWATGIDDIEIDAEDNLYFISNLGLLEAYDSIARRTLWSNNTLEVLGQPTLSPDGSILLSSGVPTFGQPGFIKAYDASDGRELWRIDLEGLPFPEPRILGTDSPRFTPDGATAYVSSVHVASPADEYSYLYAIDIEASRPTLTASGTCPGSVTVSVSNAPPASEVAVIAAAGTGGFTKGGRLCAGATFEIGEPFQLPPAWIPVDASGMGSTTMTLAPSRCWLEALAVASCETSGALQVP